MWFSVVCTLIDNDMRHHSGQNVVDSRGAATKPHSICFLPQFQRQRKCFLRAWPRAWHIDESSIVWTLIDNGKLANQIGRLEAGGRRRLILVVTSSLVLNKDRVWTYTLPLHTGKGQRRLLHKYTYGNSHGSLEFLTWLSDKPSPLHFSQQEDIILKLMTAGSVGFIETASRIQCSLFSLMTSSSPMSGHI